MNREITLRIIVESPPAGVDFGLQKGSGSNYETVQLQRSGSEDLVFTFPITVKLNNDGLPNFLGVFVQGPPNARFIYLDIGACAGQKESFWSRRLKVPLTGISEGSIKALFKDANQILLAKVPGTGKDLGPNCATVKPFAGWQISKE